MESRKFVKNIYLMFFVAAFATSLSAPIYAIWGIAGEKKFWVKSDGKAVMGDWELIDDDNDGVGYYYYFDEDGFMVTDDITPDYRIIGTDGRMLDINGEPKSDKVTNIDYSQFGVGEIISEEILASIQNEQYSGGTVKGITSSGLKLYSLNDDDNSGPKPSDNISIDLNADGTAKTLLGKNVVLKNEKNRAGYNIEIEKNMQEHIVGGDKYSKKVNGTTFNKTKWKEVMALKGTGATIVFENPSNNFNRIRGRIATHYFTYSDRTTECLLTIYNDETNDEIYSTADFNYNSGVSIDCTFPRKTNKIRFELEVSGQYTSRICYLRNFEFGFDRAAYEEEFYEDKAEEEYRISAGLGTESEVEEDEEEGEGLGEIPLEGEDPGARWRRLNNIVDDENDYLANMELEDDDTLTDAMRASIAEAKKKRDEEDEKRNRVSGPAFDKSLIEATEEVGPGGGRRIISGKEGD